MKTLINRGRICVGIIALATLSIAGCVPSDAQEVRPTFEVPAELQPGDEIQSEKHAEISSAMDEYITTLAEEERFSGTVLVARDGDIVLKKAYGLADAEANVPNAPATRYRLASITKQFTAMAILQLQEAGKLKVNDPVSRYLPDYPNGDEITIHHLLTHTSGIKEYNYVAGYIEISKQPHTPDELIALFAETRPHFPPGERFDYSNSGYVLLGRIIELVSGQTYADYVEQHIISTLHMSNSGYDSNEQHRPSHAVGYFSLIGNHEAQFFDISTEYAAGALYSTVEDLYIWDQALRSEAIANQESLDSMFGLHAEAGQHGGYYGYGWLIPTSGEPPTTAWHTGGVAGFFTNIFRYLDDEAVIIILSNFQFSPVPEMTEVLNEMLFP